MATNTGFSAAEEIFGSITGLTAKESSDGITGSVAEATNEFGDTIAHDEYAILANPSVTYAVTADVSSLPSLGDIKTWGTGADAKKILVTQIQVTTSAGQPPTVTISGQQVHDGATAKRLYTPTVTLAARCKAQDVAGAFTAPTAPAAFNSVTTTWSVDAVTATKGGNVLAACATHGRVEVNATVTDPSGSATLTAATGFTVTAPAAKTKPDEGYVSITATATKWLVGTEQTGLTVTAPAAQTGNGGN